jgi:16S rRNA (cytosine967-C5)-methyltransferase
VSGITPARRCAYTVIRRVFEQGAYADRALQAESRGLDRRDRALATMLAFGTVQRRGTLDHVISQLVSRPLAELDAPVLAALRLGVFQILYLGGVADHAAVNESVELAKRDARGGAGLVNAVLRRAAREGPGLLAGLDDTSPAAAALLHSVPEWLAAMWFEELGAERARSLLRWINEPAESALRVNTLVADVAGVLERLPVGARGDVELPEALVLEGPFDAHGSELFAEGAITPQSRGSMRVARMLAPMGGERVLDLCAAPGGKTTHLAALMENRGEIVAVESHPGRAEALRRMCARMQASCARVITADAAEPAPEPPYHRVLVDPPCSGLGTLQSRPDVRWRASPESIAELSALQARILTAAGAATVAGGTLVYSVCTISHAEGRRVVEAFLDAHPDFSADGGYLQLLPDLDHTDGFFIAKLRRA